MSQELGKLGEKIATSFLESKQYTIITIRFLKRIGEIDIIAFDNLTNELVFVEVKTRRNTTYGWPEESVTQSKLRKIIKTAKWFLLEKNYKSTQEWRIDVISIIFHPHTNHAHITHFKRIDTSQNM